MKKPYKCCDCGSYEHTVPICIGRCKIVWVDLCVAPLVVGLEAAGMSPVASCCGHGKRTMSVLLDDGREVIIRKYRTAAERGEDK